MNRTTLVAVDQGKSGTRAEARVQGGPKVHGAARSRGSEPGSSGVDAVVDAVASLRLPGPPDVVSVGTTAAPGTQDERHHLATVLRTRLAAARVLVTEDAITAHLGAFQGAPGVVVSAGTGAIALWSDGEHSARVDGWGPFLGDHGSGFAIGRAGLRAAFAAADGRGRDTALIEPARAYLGDLDLDAARRLQGAHNPTEVVAAFATEVARAAIDGDPVSAAIIANAAEELATSAALAARTAIRRGERPHCRAVGQLMLAPALRAAFADHATRAGLTVDDPLGTSLDGAMHLAVDGPPPAFTTLVGVAAAHESTPAAS